MLEYWKEFPIPCFFLSHHILSHNLCNILLSAYLPGQMTETALKVVDNLLISLNKGNMSTPALLDFSSAFGTIDHFILVCTFHADFGFTDADAGV